MRALEYFPHSTMRCLVATTRGMRQSSADIVRAGALWGYCPLTRFLAHDPHPLLEEVGLSEHDLDDTDHFVSRPAVLRLLEKSAAQLDCPDFGMRLASVQDVNI